MEITNPFIQILSDKLPGITMHLNGKFVTTLAAILFRIAIVIAILIAISEDVKAQIPVNNHNKELEV